MLPAAPGQLSQVKPLTPTKVWTRGPSEPPLLEPANPLLVPELVAPLLVRLELPVASPLVLPERPVALPLELAELIAPPIEVRPLDTPLLEEPEVVGAELVPAELEAFGAELALEPLANPEPVELTTPEFGQAGRQHSSKSGTHRRISTQALYRIRGS